MTCVAPHVTLESASSRVICCQSTREDQVPAEHLLRYITCVAPHVILQSSASSRSYLLQSTREDRDWFLQSYPVKVYNLRSATFYTRESGSSGELFVTEYKRRSDWSRRVTPLRVWVSAELFVTEYKRRSDWFLQSYPVKVWLTCAAPHFTLESGLAELSVTEYKRRSGFLQGYPVKETPDPAGGAPDDVTSSYSSQYEERLDPFTSFSRKERQRRYLELKPYDKITLSMGRLIMGNKTARAFAFFYTLILHLLVFLVLYKLAHTESCKRDMMADWHERYAEHMMKVHGAKEPPHDS
ncbi:hypothetical protein RRG08_009716 [Elysia crispata]|uniref:CASP C-terminal domain-containing protein n=1 Tax=Elysia crispata TaxID=231223 RepID=A0AAE1AAP9_9GAST|nr:hypothetical protein RRG08_009716 [Elysia crispata]